MQFAGVAFDALDFSIAEIDHAIRHAGNRGIVGNHHGGGAELDIDRSAS